MADFNARLPDMAGPSDTDLLAVLNRRVRRAEAARKEAETLLELRARALDHSNRELRQRESEFIVRLDADNRSLLRAQRTARLATLYRTRGQPWVVSPTLAELFELDPDVPDISAAAQNLVHGLDQKRFAHFIQVERKAHPGRDQQIEFRVRLASGSLRWFRFIVRHDVDDAGNFVEETGTVQDITEQRGLSRKARQLQLIGERRLAQLRRTEQRLADRISELETMSAALETSHRAAESAYQAKAQFLSTMSHAVRTPMNGVLGMITALADTDLDRAQKQQLERARRAADEIRQLMEEIINLTDAGVATTGTSRAPASAATPMFPDRRPRVLVADDISTNRAVLCGMLDAIGCDHVEVADGLAAVEAATCGGFDAILMDIQMPILDGLGATRRIKQLASPAGDVPIIGVTAQVLQNDLNRIAEAGMHACLSKPVDRDMLARVLQAAMAPPAANTIDADRFADALAAVPVARRPALVELMVADLQSLATSYADAADRGHIEDARRVRHSLAGVASNFGAVSLLETLEASRTDAPDELPAAALEVARSIEATVMASRSMLAAQ